MKTEVMYVMAAGPGEKEGSEGWRVFSLSKLGIQKEYVLPCRVFSMLNYRCKIIPVKHLTTIFKLCHSNIEINAVIVYTALS